MSIMEKTPEARPGTLQPQQDANITWLYFAPPGHTLEMCQRPDYLRNVLRECGQQRQPTKHAWNKIEIIAEDGTWEAELRITSVADGLVTTRALRVWRDPKAADKPATPKGYKTEHVPSNGWRSLDPAGAVIVEKKQTEIEAIRAAIDHAKKAKGD